MYHVALWKFERSRCLLSLHQFILDLVLPVGDLRLLVSLGLDAILGATQTLLLNHAGLRAT